MMTTTTVELNGDIERDTDVDILSTDMETGPGTLATSSGSTMGSTTETMAPVTKTTSPPPPTESSRESPTNTVVDVDGDIVPDIPMDSTTSTSFTTSTSTVVISSAVADGTAATSEMDSNRESTSSPPTEGIVTTTTATTPVSSVIPQVVIEIDGLDSIADDDGDSHTDTQSDAPTISLAAKEQESEETSEPTRPATVFATFRNVEEGEVEGGSPEGEVEGGVPTETTPTAIIADAEAATTITNASWPSGERLGDYTSCGFTCCTNDDCADGGGCCVEGKCVLDDIATAEARNGMGSEERCGAVIGPPADVVCGYDAWLAFEMDGNCV
mmetsp:Transcript_12013/g.22560  ORF Transcript_12013/g.22560 Transcript_12013/m.22560 type:complete len:328 (+) Transcript_12013:2411-3394(+)